jgi:hypothetical protein
VSRPDFCNLGHCHGPLSLIIGRLGSRSYVCNFGVTEPLYWTIRNSDGIYTIDQKPREMDGPLDEGANHFVISRAVSGDLIERFTFPMEVISPCFPPQSFVCMIAAHYLAMPRSL